jgi:hypothetical protein
MSLLPNTATKHNRTAACGRKDNSKDTTETQGTVTSHYLGQKKNHGFIFREGGEETKVLGENP